MSSIDQLARDAFELVSRGAAPREIASKIETLLSTVSVEPSGAISPELFTLERHPLGFLAGKWRIDTICSLRVHMWDDAFDWGMSADWGIHDHIFMFDSVVLIGEVRNSLYSVDTVSKNDGNYFRYEVAYAGNRSHLERQSGTARLSLTHEKVHIAGERYRIDAGQLHRSHLVSRVGVTALAASTVSEVNVRPIVWSPHDVASFAFDRTQPMKDQRLAYLQRFVALVAAAWQR